METVRTYQIVNGEIRYTEDYTIGSGANYETIEDLKKDLEELIGTAIDSYEIETINEEEKTMKTTNTMNTNATMTTDNFEGLQIAADALRLAHDMIADTCERKCGYNDKSHAIVKALNEIADIMQTAGENDYNPDEKYTPAEYAELIADLIVEYTAYIG